MDILIKVADVFIGMFNKGGEIFMGLATGILPTLIVLLTFVNSLIALIGEERVTKFARFCTKNVVLRYTVFPVLAVFFVTSPMCFAFGRFLPEKQKPAFYDAAVSFVHPITGLFPHANSGELFVWLGISVGITELGLSATPLAVRYFLVGMMVMLLRGVVTELLTGMMWKKPEQAEQTEKGGAADATNHSN